MKRLAALLVVVLLGPGCTSSAATGTSRSEGTTQEAAQSLPSAAAEAPIGARPPRRIVWVSVEDDQRVVAVDLRARRIIRRFRVSGVPHNVTVTGDTVAVANEGRARVDLVSIIDGDRVASIRLKANPHDLAITPDFETAWVTLDGSDEMAVVNLGRRRVLRYVPTGRRPHDLIFTPDGRLWVTDWGGSLHVFSRRGRLLRTISVGVEAHHLAFTPGIGRRRIWLTDHGTHSVFVIDAGTLKVVAELDTGGAPHHVAFTPDGRLAVVVDHDGDRILVYRARTRRLVARIAVGEGPHGVWAEPAR
jgi:YVTN family beta-propeller protein